MVKVWLTDTESNQFVKKGYRHILTLAGTHFTGDSCDTFPGLCEKNEFTKF